MALCRLRPQSPSKFCPWALQSVSSQQLPPSLPLLLDFFFLSLAHFRVPVRLFLSCFKPKIIFLFLCSSSPLLPRSLRISAQCRISLLFPPKAASGNLKNQMGWSFPKNHSPRSAIDGVRQPPWMFLVSNEHPTHMGRWPASDPSSHHWWRASFQ